MDLIKCRSGVKCISILLFLCFVVRPAASEPQKVGAISFLIGGPGDVLIKKTSTDKWKDASLKMDLFEKDVIKTGAEARVEILLLDQSVLRIGENSELELTKGIVEKTSKEIQADLKTGRVWANVTKLTGKNDQFQIKAPTAVCAVRGTIYRIDADSVTTLLVYDGEIDVGPLSLASQPQQPQQPRSLKPVEVPPPHEIPPPYEVTLEEWIRIVQGYQVTVRSDKKYEKKKIDDEKDSKLDWVMWNRARDNQINRN